MILILHDSLLHLSDNSMTCFDLSSRNFKATATFQLNQTQSNFLRQQFYKVDARGCLRWITSCELRNSSDHDDLKEFFERRTVTGTAFFPILKLFLMLPH